MTLSSMYLLKGGQDCVVNISEMLGGGEIANDILKLP